MILLNIKFQGQLDCYPGDFQTFVSSLCQKQKRQTFKFEQPVEVIDVVWIKNKFVNKTKGINANKINMYSVGSGMYYNQWMSV